MTIRPGEPWGDAAALAGSAPVCSDDAAAGAVLQQRLDALAPRATPDLTAGSLGEVGLVGGDLHRTLGSPARSESDLREGRGTRFPVDVGVARIDGTDRVFVAHLIAHPARRIRWWSVRTIVAMNAAFVGELDLGPRSHPNDGRLDLTDGSLPLGQRRRGRRRARSGTHVPHPDLDTRSVRSLDVDFDPSAPMHVWLDGVHVGTVSRLALQCVADAAFVVA